MKDENKTKEQLIDELEELRQRISKLKVLKTKRKGVDEEMKDSEERLKILFEFAPDAYFVNDFKGNFVHCNKAAEKLTGYKKKELLGKSFLKLKLLSPNQIPKAVNGLAKIIMGKTRPPVEYTLKNKDGNQVEVEISTYPIKIRGRALATAIARDITERKKAEEALKNALVDLQSTFNSTEDLIMLLDKEFKIIRANLSTARFIGLDINEILGKKCYQLLHKTKTPPDICPLKKMKQTKKHEEAELYLAERDVWISVSVDPVFNDKGNLIRCVHIIKDITERKKAEEKEKQYASSLAFLSRTAMEFVEFPSESDIYQFIGKRLRELVGNSFVLVNSFDETTQCIQAQ